MPVGGANAKVNRHNHGQSSSLVSWWCSFPRIAVLAVCSLVFQLVALNIGVSVFHENTLTKTIDAPVGGSTRNAIGVQKSDFRLGTSERLSQNPSYVDGRFHGYPLRFVQKQPKEIESISHCVGENYQEDSWKKKSCQFQFFCFDVATKEYVVFDRAENDHVYENAEGLTVLDISQSFLKKSVSNPNSMSLGGINLKWSGDIARLKWFPDIRVLSADQSPLSYYELPPNVVMVPFHSLNGSNPGHLVWDDFLPIFTLLSMFQLEQKSNELLLMRYILKDDARGLWASCDWTDEKKEACRKMYHKFLPLMLGTNPVHEYLGTTEEFDFEPSHDATKQSTLVCAKHGLAGIGPLTDHGTSKLHGWSKRDYEMTQNHGRGGMLYEFRNFMLRNMNIPIELNHKPPFRIIFSEKSSSIETRNFDFTKQKELLERSFHPSYISVESYVMSELSLAEQLEITSQASIFITSCGGGAVSSIFMPKGSSVIMYYVEDGGVIGNKRTGTPARLDWDLFNNLGYLKVHWLPSGTMHTDYDMKALARLIEHDLDTLLRERTYDHFFH